MQKLAYFTLILSSIAFGDTQVVTEEHLRDLLKHTIDVHAQTNADFADLKNVKIDVVPKLHEHAYYFQANPHHFDVLFRKNDTYYVEYNPEVLPVAPTDQAIQAILTHELFHVIDMENRSSFGNLRFAIGYGLGIRKVHYEHYTDARAVDEGEGLGLIDYRNWVYSRLTGKDLEKKKKIYMTPEEITFQMSHSSPSSPDSKE